MPVKSQYTIIPAPESTTGSGTSVSRPPVRESFPGIIGRGIITPFTRGPGDITTDDTVALIQSNIGQILATRCSDQGIVGELPWRSEFGSLLYTLRHAQNNEITAELASLYITEALTRWEPRVQVKSVETQRLTDNDGQQTVLAIRLTYDITTANSQGNNVIIPNVTQTIIVEE